MKHRSMMKSTISLKNMALASAVFGICLGGFSASFAGDYQSKKNETAEKRMAAIEKKFEPTGEKRQCVNVTQLRSSKAIDDQTIFFDYRGRKGFMNRLPRSCPRLQYEDRFSYRISSGTQLCRGEIITVIDNFGRSWGSCTLGDFELWTKTDEDKEKSESGNE